MADRNKENTSQTFGKYSGSASKTKKTDGPKNISSDMWTPISTGKTEQMPAKKSPQPKKNKSQAKKAQPKKPAPAPSISEGRGGNDIEKKGRSKSSAKKDRAPKGRPISELTSSADAKRNKAKQLRQTQQRNKEDRHFDEGLRGGKSPSEMSKERAAKKRKKRIRRNIISVSLFLVFIIAFLGIYIYSKGAPVAVIKVEGDSIYTKEEIITAAGVSVGDNMFALREENINTLIAAELPYVHSIEIKRQLPDSITLCVTATTDKYLIVNGKNYICVDGYGKILSDEVKDLQEGFFRIKGFKKIQDVQIGAQYTPDEADSERYEIVKSIVTAAENQGIIKSGVINASDLRNVRLYSGGIMIYLGTCFDVERQITDAGNIISTQFTEGEKGYINVKTKAPAFQKGTLKAD